MKASRIILSAALLSGLGSTVTLGACMAVDESKLLAGMYSDGYFPNHLVDKGKAVLVELCEQLEANPPETADQAYVLTHAATKKFNELQEEFEAEGSEIETAAREDIAESIAVILDATGVDYDLEEAIAPRDW